MDGRSFDDCDLNASTGCETPLGTDDDCAACGDTCDPAAEAIDCIPAGEPCVVVDHCFTKICANGLCAAAACIGLGGSCDLLNDNCCAGGACTGTCL